MQDVQKLWGQRRDRKCVKTTVHKYRDVSFFFAHEEWFTSSGHCEERVDALERSFVFDGAALVQRMIEIYGIAAPLGHCDKRVAY